MRVGEVLVAYNEQKLASQKRGRATFQCLRQFLEPLLDQALAATTVRQVAALYERMSRVAPSHAKHAIDYAIPFMAWAQSTGLVRCAPELSVLRQPPGAPRERQLTIDELQRIWAAALALDYPFDAAVQLLILTLVRRDAVGALRLSDLTPGPGWLWTATLNGAAGADFTVPLPAIAVDVIQGAIRRRPAGSQFVFSGNGETPVSGWSRAKRRLDAIVASEGAQAVMEPWRFNDIRASFAAIVSKEVQLPRPVIDRCLGRFSRFNSELAREWAFSAAMLAQHREALEAWSDFFARE